MGQTEAVLTWINYRVKTTQPHSHAAHGAHSVRCENQEEPDTDSGREAQEGGHRRTLTADPRCCAAEANNILMQLDSN